MPEDYFVNIDMEAAVAEAEERRKAIPKAVYLCKVKSVEKKLKEGEGKYPYLDVRLTPVDYPQKTLYVTLSFHPDAVWNLVEFIHKSGIPYDKRGFNYMLLKDKMIRVTVNEEPSQENPEEMRNTVNPPYHKA